MRHLIGAVGVALGFSTPALSANSNRCQAFSGTWEGRCEYTEGSYREPYDMTLVISFNTCREFSIDAGLPGPGGRVMRQIDVPTVRQIPSRSDWPGIATTVEVGHSRYHWLDEGRVLALSNMQLVRNVVEPGHSTALIPESGLQQISLSHLYRLSDDGQTLTETRTGTDVFIPNSTGIGDIRHRTGGCTFKRSQSEVTSSK